MESEQNKDQIFSKASLVIIAILLLIMSALGLYAYKDTIFPQPKKASAAQTVPEKEKLAIQVTNQKKETTNYNIDLKDGETAFEALKRLQQENNSFKFAYKEFSFGAMITSINGFEPDSKKQFWGFKVNGKDSELGISSYKVKKNDVLLFIVTDLM